jgi:hypothetical protein
LREENGIDREMTENDRISEMAKAGISHHRDAVKDCAPS